MLSKFGAAFLYVAVALAAAAAAQTAPQPSFDCSKATRAVDKLICASPELARADARLALAYNSRMAALQLDADRKALRDEQRSWLERRDALCPVSGEQAAAVRCLAAAYAQRIAQLDHNGPAGAPSSRAKSFAMDDTALTAAHPAERVALDFPQGAFSRDGKLFAFAVSQIVSGDSDQVWLYRLSDKRLVAVTPSPVRNKYNITIDGFFWDGNVLYVQGNGGVYGEAQMPFISAATTSGTRGVTSVPKVVTPPGEARDTTAEAGDALSDQGDRREENDRYQVTSKNQGHGALTLTARDKKSRRSWTIATGTWNLESFVLDAPRARVIYVNGTGGLDVYNLATKRVTSSVNVPVGVLLDVTRDGKLAAFTGNGACAGAMPPGDAARRKLICFVALD